LTTLHSFAGFSDGNSPSSILQGRDGNFYGTTADGGTNSCLCGTVFKISPAGTLTTIYSFGGSYGLSPETLVQGDDGYLYGITSQGGTSANCYAGCGTVFKVDSEGGLTSLYSFSGDDGEEPQAIVQASDGNFYGTTGGGTNGLGTVFTINSAGDLKNLYQFGSGDGKYPQGLTQGSDGNFYGTTGYGGTNSDGTVFKLSVPLSPPANQIAGLQFLSVFNTTYTALLIPSVAGEIYQLQYTDSMNPTNWINSGEPIVSIGGPLTTFDFIGPATPQRFYRFAITP
jgi:uncharacterized repeat protein (TIGR03803 family)